MWQKHCSSWERDLLQLRKHTTIGFEKENKVSTKEGSLIRPQSAPPSCPDQTGSEWFYNLPLQTAEFKHKLGAGTRVKGHGEIEPPLDGNQGEPGPLVGDVLVAFSPLPPSRCITTGDLRRRT